MIDAEFLMIVGLLFAIYGNQCRNEFWIMAWKFNGFMYMGFALMLTAWKIFG